MSIIWVLGAPDAEMTAIENLLRECGQPFLYALGSFPRETEAGDITALRVRPGQTATAAGETYPTGDVVWYDLAASFPGRKVIAIEVAGPWGQPAIDHHDEHPLASAPPEEFLRASSLGQVISRLAQMEALPAGWGGDFLESIGTRGLPSGELIMSPGGWSVVSNGCFRIIPQALVMEAAADHCLAAAFAGACPGIDPVEGGNFWRTIVASRRAVFAPDMSEEEYAAALARAQLTLRTGPPALDLDPIPEDVEEGVAYPSRESLVRDLTHLDPFGRPAAGTGERYPDAFQFGPLVGAITGLGYLVRVVNRDGSIGMRLGGCGLRTRPGPKPVQRWLDGVGEARGCYPIDAPRPKNLYGSGARGFGGGTLREG